MRRLGGGVALGRCASAACHKAVDQQRGLSNTERSGSSIPPCSGSAIGWRSHNRRRHHARPRPAGIRQGGPALAHVRACSRDDARRLLLLLLQLLLCHGPRQAVVGPHLEAAAGQILRRHSALRQRGCQLGSCEQLRVLWGRVWGVWRGWGGGLKVWCGAQMGSHGRVRGQWAGGRGGVRKQCSAAQRSAPDRWKLVCAPTTHKADFASVARSYAMAPATSLSCKPMYS